MAQVGEDTGIPKVEASTEGNRVRATPEDFGAGIGTGFQKLGAGLNQATDFYSQVAADDATNNWHKKVETILYGDPNNPDTPGYFGMHGADAMREKPNVLKAMQAAADEERQHLPLAQTQFQFDQDTRRSRFLFDQQVGSHYEQQSQQWGIKTTNDKLTMAKDAVARNPNDPTTLSLSLIHAREAAVRLEQLQNGSSADPSAAILKADQEVRLAQLDAMRVNDPAAALKLLTEDPGGEVLRSLPNYASLVHVVQEDAVNAASAQHQDTKIGYWKGQAAQAVQQPAGQTPLAGGTQPLVDKVDPQYRGAVGNILAGESVHDPHSAGPSKDFKHAGLGQFDVGTWKQVTGHDIAPEDVGVVGKDPRLDAAQSVQAIAAYAKLNRDRYVKDFGREPNAGDLALMHQQGTGGGMHLLHGLVNNPNAPATNYVSADALANNRIPEGATVAQAVRHIEDYYTAKGKGGSFGGGGAEGQYMSQSDYMNDKLVEAVDDYRTSIADDPAFRGRADLIDRAVNNFENAYRRTIRDQNTQYMAEAHEVSTRIHQSQATSLNEFLAQSPDNAALYFHSTSTNPNIGAQYDRLFAANAVGQAKTYGSQFTETLSHVLAPVGDPNRITDPAKIMGMVSRGENGLLTNTGANTLIQLLNARNAPGGESDATQLRGFLTQAHGIIAPLTKPSIGNYSPTQEKRYAQFIDKALKLVAAGKADGLPLSEILKKGGAVDTLMGQGYPTPKEQAEDQKALEFDKRMKPVQNALKYLKKSADIAYLQKGIDGENGAPGVISPYQAGQAVKMGALNTADLKTAYDKGWLEWDDVDEAVKHLKQYHRNFWGQPVK